MIFFMLPSFASGKTEPQHKEMMIHDLITGTLILWSSLHSQAYQHTTKVMDNFTIWSDITWNQKSNAEGRGGNKSHGLDIFCGYALLMN